MSDTAPLSPTQVDELDSSQLALLIDHTLLAPTATAQDIDKLCDQAAEFITASVCVQPIWVAHAAKRLAVRSSVFHLEPRPQKPKPLKLPRPLPRVPRKSIW